jgi:DNA/RNA-binding domain of Phe-tRNA-synthetase-like protein
VTSVDEHGHVHARRRCERQSTLSAARPTKARASIVAEAMHATAADDVRELIGALAGELQALWDARSRSAMLTKDAPLFQHTG